jgi:chaperonin GroES
MKLRPLYDQILVRRTEPKSETEGGLIIPETAKLKSRHGAVLAVGSGRVLPNGQLRPIDVKVGDVVYFRGVNGHEIELDGEKLVLLKEGEIEGLVDEP